MILVPKRPAFLWDVQQICHCSGDGTWWERTKQKVFSPAQENIQEWRVYSWFLRPTLFKNTMKKKKKKVLVAQSCPTLCDPMDYRPPGSSVHGILQARILEWVPIPFSRGSFPRIEPGSPALQADSLQSKPPGKTYQSEKDPYPPVSSSCVYMTLTRRESAFCDFVSADKE